MLSNERIRDFRERLDKYLGLGINLLSLAIGCSVKVDLYDILYPALSLVGNEIAKLNIEIQPREDVAVLRSNGDYSLTRRIYNIDGNNINKDELTKINPSTALLLLQVHQARASSPREFAGSIISLYRQLGTSPTKIRIGKGHSIVSTREKAEFALIDFIGTRTGNEYLLANNDTIQIIDPTEDPGSYRQVATAVSNALNDLFIKGVYRDITIYPVYDAPIEELREKLMNNYREFSGKWNFQLDSDVPQPRVNYLLMGATVVGLLDKEPPMFYDNVKAGFKVLVTRPFGELSIISTYLTAHVDESLMDELERDVMGIDELEKLKVKIMETLSRPNIEIAKVLNKYLPELGESFKDDEHIAGTIDISGPGIFVFKELAEQANVDIALHNIPLISPEIASFAAGHYIITDATAGTNGAIAIVASKDVIDSIIKDLRGIEGTQPMVIGDVIGKGTGRLFVPDYITKYITSKSLLMKLTMDIDVLRSLRRQQVRCEKVRVEARVFGDVQGVGFRPTLRRQALSFGLTGYVRNLPDGSVEVVIEGCREDAMALIEWIRSSPVGSVDMINYVVRQYNGEFVDFEVR
ncbi:SelD-related putative sulfur metabolism protein [Vulcanisaeta souniana]|uniref:acylphosphatase n=2 Tax=Vulcanisaeta souniana TaxID=164452 RepID=A0ABN6SU55_9CREN|nr:SelD-related putative sulfur metabolism protein [Vulcanisaeta souniana]BDR92818.1 selenophosphate synthetase [Vulcanisaeta souniana JCM 11219]